ncbi:MAG: hypothetical protein IPI64_10370 [Chloracidobacterium sp.]|nr:hypothetical protein [Chloracidobacterium sp.]
MTATGTVNVTVSGMIWFVNAGAAAGGDGRLSDPFNCYTGAGCFSAVAADDPGDNIFLYTGAYTGGNTLLANQKLIGQGASSTLISITGLTLAASSDALPATGGTNPTITTTGSNAIPLNNTNTGNTIRGLTVGNTGGGVKILGTNFGTLTVGNSTTPDVALSGTGKALDLTNGTFAATSAFSSVATTSSTTHGMQIITVGGTVAFGSTSVSGSTAQGIFVNNSGVNLNFGNTTVGATGGATECVRLETNTGGTRTFGTLGLTSCSAQGITISGAGNVNVTGQTTITNPGNVGILANTLPLANTITFANVTVNGSGSTGVSLSTNSGAVSFADLDIAPASGQTAFTVASSSGTTSSTSGTITATAAQAINSSSSVLSMILDSVSASGGASSAVNLTSSSGSIVMNGGTITGNSSGRAFLVNSGTVTSTYKGNISQANATELIQVTGGHNTGTVSFNTGTLSATNGTGLLFDNADGNYTFNGTTTLNGGDAGIDIINGSGGQFSFGSGTTITNPSGIAYREDTSTANVNIDGTISKTNNAANAVSINAKSGGLTGFNGGVTATTTTANAINLTSNSGGAITFGGGLALSTTSGIGFNATGGGTVIAAQTPPLTVNTIASTTGTALNVANTNIGASGLTFRSISSNGSASGIVLNATGASGGLAVSGNGGTCSNAGNCTGGAIQNTTGVGISLTSTRNVDLTRMFIGSTGSQGVSGTGLATSNANPSFALRNSRVTSPGDADNETALFFGNVLAPGNNTGSLVVADTVVEQFEENGLEVYNNTGTLTVTVTGTLTGLTDSTMKFDDNNDTYGQQGVLIVAAGTANITTNVSGTFFNNIEAEAIMLQSTAATSSIDVNLLNNISINGGGPDNFPSGGGFAIVQDVGGSATFDINNNNIRDLQGDCVVIIADGPSQGRINNNVLSGSLVGDGVRIDTDQLPANGNNFTVTIQVQGNSIGNDGTFPGIGDDGIQILHRDGTKTLNLTIENNTIANTASEAIRHFQDADVSDGALRPYGAVRVAGNTMTNIGVTDAFVFQTQETADLDLHVTGNTFPAAGNRNILLTQTGTSVLQITQASVAALAAANTNSTTLGSSGTITVNSPVTNPPLPTNPIAPPADGLATMMTVDSDSQDRYSTFTATATGPVETNPTVVEWSPDVTVLASASVETPVANVEWASANIEIVPAAVETPAADENTPSTFAAIASLVDKMTSQISPTVYSQETEKEAPKAGTVTVNGGGSGFTIPAGKSTTIVFRAAISNPTTPVNTFSVSNQGTVSGGNFTSKLTDDPAVAGATDPTVTTVVQPPTITKSFTPASILLDQQSTLTLTINNTNPAQAVTGITVTDTFPANVVVASPLTANTTCGAGTLQNNSGGVLAVGDPGIKLVNGTRAAAQSCTVTVKVRGTIGGTYPNTTGNVASFEGFTGTTAIATLNVSILTATELSISGRVLTSGGAASAIARIVITGNSLAQPISVFTGVNGTYQVNGLAAGETYIVTVMSRRFTFETPSRVVTLIDNVTDADFIGSSGTNREQ